MTVTDEHALGAGCQKVQELKRELRMAENVLEDQLYNYLRDHVVDVQYSERSRPRARVLGNGDLQVTITIATSY